MKGNYCTITVVLFFIVYVSYTAYEVYKVMNPVYVLDNSPSLDPLWKEGQEVHALCYLSSKKKWDWSQSKSSKVFKVGDFTGLTFDWMNNHRNIVFNLSASDPSQKNLWKKLRNNGTVYLHVHVAHHNHSPNPQDDTYDKLKTLHSVTPIVRYSSRRNQRNSTKLLAPYFGSHHDIQVEHDPLDEVDHDTPDPALTADTVSYWKPEIAVRLVTDFTRFPIKQIPPLVYNNIQIVKLGNGAYKYSPVMYVDEMGMTADKLIPLNRTSKTLHLTVTYEPMSLSRWQMLLTFEQAFAAQQKLGVGDTDMDDMRNMISDTNPYLLAVTFTVALLHALFDFLAFKSDVNFWRKNKSLVGISIRSMVVSFFSQVVVFLYLFDNKANFLILVPSGISLLIQLWKIRKATGISLKYSEGRIKIVYPRLEQEEMSTVSTTETSQIDTIAMTYMSYVFYPLIFGFAVYSLVYRDHTSWYSWVLSSLTGTVYTFGFIMMTPQLFINYKLKSVAHLPWRFLVYRALNTFIDDLFAFIIRMPTMHRISCFRDDVVFFIYVYQRWIYPVDQSRAHMDEDGIHEHQD